MTNFRKIIFFIQSINKDKIIITTNIFGDTIKAVTSIPPAMPKWMVKKGTRFETSVSNDSIINRNFDSILWGDTFYPVSREKF